MAFVSDDDIRLARMAHNERVNAEPVPFKWSNFKQLTIPDFPGKVHISASCDGCKSATCHGCHLTELTRYQFGVASQRGLFDAEFIPDYTVKDARRNHKRAMSSKQGSLCRGKPL